MNEKKQPSNRQLKVGQQIRFLVSNFFIKEDFIFENFDSKNLTVVDVVFIKPILCAEDLFWKFENVLCWRYPEKLNPSKNVSPT